MKKFDKVVIPISDTVPGPGTQEIEPNPSTETDVENDYIGHGTAQDVPSSSTVPEPNSDE